MGRWFDEARRPDGAANVVVRASIPGGGAWHRLARAALLTVLASALLLASRVALADTQTLPQGFASTMGSSSTAYPFGNTNDGTWQWHYDSGEFVNQGPIVITGVAVRADSGTSSAFSYPSVEVILIEASTDYQVASHAPLFANNILTSSVVRTGAWSGGATAGFVSLGLTGQFVYDPSTGNDFIVMIRKCGTTTSFCALDGESGATGTVGGNRYGNLSSCVATQEDWNNDEFVPIVEITYAPVGATCGNNNVEGSEVCDDGNTNDCDGCRGDCSAYETGCGDTFVCGNEACDDGNNNNCDSCSDACTLITGCGDGEMCGNEACDDGNTQSCDGCSATCVTETGCGDGAVCGNEVCDDGNTSDCDGCRGDCSAAETGCGDTFVCGNEVCDDGNTADCDGCRADCSAAETGCGDTFICGTETCDDGNATACDGCSDLCVTETGCGDGTVCGTEVCDDGNTVDCDGCAADCSLAETGCGDGAMCGTEACDDGNTTDCDGCSAVCGTETGCGDGVVCGSEQCDDGNTIDGDGCSSTCMSEGAGGAGGGTSSGTGGTTSSGTGGASSSGSSSGSDGDATDDGGCGCRVVGESRSNNLAALGLLGLLGLVVTRRRRAA
ncbi:MAG: DUF4215 domain-containing protein [Deltaproteobacteria bacterium]|nr:DUF4215 domain-containing protein [Deltaproteobacteria bacterium]